MAHFYTPWKRQKTYGFLTFSGGIEIWHWTKWVKMVSKVADTLLINTTNDSIIRVNVSFYLWKINRINIKPVVSLLKLLEDKAFFHEMYYHIDLIDNSLVDHINFLKTTGNFVTLWSEALPAVNYYHKALHLDVAAVLDPPLLIIPIKLKKQNFDMHNENIDLQAKDKTSLLYQVFQFFWISCKHNQYNYTALNIWKKNQIG